MSTDSSLKVWREAVSERQDWEGDIVELWEENGTPSVFSVPLGVHVGEGRVVQLSIDQSAFAHGAIYGGVGVGKSVALDTLLTGLGVKYPPEVVEFVFASGKGAPVEASQLPHTREVFDVSSPDQVEAFSDFVGGLIESRQRFAEERDIMLVLPSDLPAVFVVVEEVSGVSGLDDVLEKVVTVGRSLGVHLILVGQQVNGRVFPSEVVNNIGWAVGFRPEDGDVFSDNVGALPEKVVPGEGFLLTQSFGEAIRVFNFGEWEDVFQGQKG